MERRSFFFPGRLWRWLWLLAVISGLWVIPAVAEKRPPLVLIINSYHPGNLWSDDELTGLLERLHQRYPELDPAIEYLDAKRFSTEGHLLFMKDYLAGKNRGQKFDLVITLDDPALKMVLEHRKELFPGIPLVFAGIENLEPSMLASQEKVTGFREVGDTAGTLKLALSLHPQTREVFVIHDYTMSGLASRKEVEEVSHRFQNQVQFKYTPKGTIEEIVSQIKALPANTLMLITSFSTDSSGRAYPVSESVHQFTHGNMIPAYATHEPRLGHGIVGGILLGGKEQGRHAGDIALRVLAGEDPAKIPVETKSTARPMFDYEQLARFGIPLGALPEGSLIINRPESFYYKHRALFWGTLFLMVTLSLVVVSLTVTIMRRRRAEEALRKSEEELRAILDSTPFPVAIVDLLGDKIHFWSRSALTIFGYTAPTASEWYQNAYPDPNYRSEVTGQWNHFMEIAHESRQTVNTGEYRITCSNGTVRICELYATFILDHPIVTFNDITERKRAEELLSINYNALFETTQHLEQSRNMLQLIIESVPVRVFWKDSKLRFLGCNTLFARDAGLSQPEELIGKDDFAMGWRDHAEDYRANDRQVMESRRPKLNIVEPQTTPTGGKIWLNTSKVPLQRPNGEVFGVLGIYEDITERKRTEEALLKYKFIADTANDFMTLISNYIYESANAAFCQAHGKTREEMVGTSLANIWGEDRFNKKIKGDIGRCFTGQTVESEDWFEFGKLSRGCYHILYTPYFNEDGTVVYVAVVSHDITARKRNEKSLRESEEKFRLVFEKAPLGIMNYDQISTTTDCNAKFAEIIGAPKEKFIGFNMMRQIVDDKMREAVAAALKGEVGYYEGDYLSVTAGKLTPLRAIYQPIFSSNGTVSGGVAIFEDISERKLAELERLQFSKLESLGTLAGGIAHDFNNILTAILGNIGLAALDDKIGPRVKDRLAQAEAACLRAQALSLQLLTFAKGGAPVKKLVSVRKLLTETTVFACVGSPVKCETTFPENLWSIEADPGQISQIFQNLTINAIQAMPIGGMIKLWAENLTLGTESVLPLGPGRYIKISVRDQGMGIPAEHLPRIFDPYFTTKHKGSGLGLASTYAIIKKHRGHIAAESEPGVGTTFYIYLPAVEKQVTPQPEEDRELPVGKGKILVMDDEEMVREVLGRTLALLGYEAEFARDGGEAIKMFVQAQAFGQAFTAVILDLTVPGGMGGKETMARLREIDPQVKAIVSSGYADDPIMADFQKYGFSGVIAKPYQISELGKILQEVAMGKQ